MGVKLMAMLMYINDWRRVMILALRSDRSGRRYDDDRRSKPRRDSAGSSDGRREKRPARG